MGPRRYLLIVAAVLFLCVGSTRAWAETSPDASGAIELKSPVVATHDAARQRALSESPTWQDFRARNGHWSAIWNEATSSPHLAFGDAIPLERPVAGAAQVDRAVRRFIGRHPQLFGTPHLETVRAQQVGEVWYASYRQSVHGVPVLF